MTTIGQRLDEPDRFFWWLNHALGSFITLNAAVESGFLEKLGEEPATLESLAQSAGIPTASLGRLIGFLAAEEILELLPDGRVAHTPRSRNLGSLRAALRAFQIYFDAGVRLPAALTDGRTAFEHRFGKPVFEYLGDNPDAARVFADFMAYLTSLVEAFVFAEHRFEPFGTAVDVGGSHGSLLLGLLAGHPDARGIVFDLPEVAAMVANNIRASEHGSRVEVVGGNFFEAVPAADLYLLKMILHDWNDDECIAILGRIRESVAANGRVAVIEYLMPESPSQHPAYAMDLAMLVWATGRERKLSEFESLFDASGFRLDRVTENPFGQSVIEAVAA